MSEVENVLLRKIRARSSPESGSATLAAIAAALEAAVARNLSDLLTTAAGALTETCAFKPAKDILANALLSSLFGRFEMAGASDTGFFVVDSSLCDVFIDFLAGRDVPGGANKSERLPTQIDERICRRILDSLFAGFARCLPPGIGAGSEYSFKTTNFLSAAAAEQNLPDAELLLVDLALDFGQNGRNGRMSMAMPAEWIEKLEACSPANSHGSPAAKNMLWRQNMLAVAAGMPVELKCVLHRSTLPFSIVNSYDAGDVIVLKGAKAESIDLEFASASIGNIRLTNGELGAFHGQKAFKFAANAAASDDAPGETETQTTDIQDSSRASN